MLKHVTMLCAAAGALCVEPLRAQDIPRSDFKEAERPLGVRERIAAEYQPIGGRIGSFFLYPEGDVSANVTDNVFATDQNEKGELWIDGSAGFRFIRPDQTRRVQVEGRIGQTIHTRFEDENRTTLLGRLFYRGGPVEASHFEIGGLAARQFVPRRDINDVKEARSPVQYELLSSDIAYTFRRNRAALEVGASVRRRDFNDARDRAGQRIDQDFRDLTLLTLRAEGGYELSPPVMLLVRTAYTRFNYDFGPGSRDFDETLDSDRDSDLWRVEAGVGVALTERLHGSATVGYSRRTFGEQPNKPRNSGGPSFAADLLWLPNPATTVTIEAETDFIESASPSIAGYRTVGARIRVDRSVARSLILSLEGNVRNLNPVGDGQNRTEYDIAAEANYFLSRRYRIFGLVGYGGRNADNGFGSFNEAQMRVGVALTL